MKKKVLLILTALLLVSVVMCVVGCEELLNLINIDKDVCTDGNHEYTYKRCDADNHILLCEKCGESVTEPHDWVIDENLSTPATETSEGVNVSVCSKCGVMKEESVAKLEHQHVFGEPSYVWNGANCTAKTGCATCNYALTETVVGSYVTDTELTCTQSETGHYLAVFENAVFEQQSSQVFVVTQFAGHKLTAHQATSATCENTGNSAYWTCDNCGKCFDDENAQHEIQPEVISAYGHNLQIVESISATCTQNGTREYYVCTNDGCGKCFDDADGKNEIADISAWKLSNGNIPAFGHVLTLVKGYTDTLEDGWKDYYQCQNPNCGLYFEDEQGTKQIDDLDAWKQGDGKVLSDLHKYGLTVTYVWDGANCTAKGSITGLDGVIVEQTVQGTYHKTADATCIAKEQGYYTATFDNELIVAYGNTVPDCQVEVGEPLGHNYVANVCTRCTAGTDGHELSQAEIIDLLFGLGADEQLAGSYKLTGVITQTTFTESDGITFDISLQEKTVRVVGYDGEFAQSIYKGDTVTVVGSLKDDNGTKQFDSVSSVNVDVVGQVQITLVAENATVTGLGENALNGSTLTFTVSSDYKYRVSEVTAYGKALTANQNGEYGFIVNDGDVTVNITCQNMSVATEKLLYSVTFPDSNSDKNKVSAYNKSWTAIIDGHEWTVSGFNNNNWSGGWTYIKCGSKNNDYIAYITTSFDTVIDKVVLKVSAVTPGNVNAIYLEYADNEQFTNAKRIGVTVGNGNLTFEIPEENLLESGYYRVAIDCKKSSNGIATISGLDYYELFKPHCEHEFVYKDLEANGVVAFEQTCTEAAKYYYTCRYCGKVEGNKQHVWSVDGATGKGHDYGELIGKVDATCTKDGLEAHFYCKDCGCYFANDTTKTLTTFEQLVIAQFGHNLVVDESVQPVWNIDENKVTVTLKCTNSGCQHTETTVIGVVADSTKPTVLSTCTTQGSSYYIATYVNGDYFKTLYYEQKLVINPDNHKISESWSSDETGHWHVCEYGCENVFDFAQHTFGELIVDTPATEQAKGAGHKLCDCGYRIDVEIPELAHVHQYNDNLVCACGNVSPDAVAQIGNSETASENKYFASLQSAFDGASQGDTVLLIKDLQLTASVQINTAITLDLGEYTLSFDANGLEVNVNFTLKNGTLQAQGAVLTVTSGKTSISRNITVIGAIVADVSNMEITAGTFSFDVTELLDKTTYHCTKSGETYIVATHGTLAEHTANDATCTQDGNILYYTCPDCDIVLTKQDGKYIVVDSFVTNALGHDIQYFAHKDSSCLEAGVVEHYHCNRCNRNFEDEQCTTEFTGDVVIQALPHTYGELVAQSNPDCTNAGVNAYYYCSVCKQYFDENKQLTTLEALTVSALGHSWERDGFVATADDYGRSLTEHWFICSCGVASAHVTHSHNADGKCICGTPLAMGSEVIGYTLLTDASQLVDGAKVVIAAAGSNYAMGVYAGSNNIPQVAITKSDNSFTMADGVGVYTLGYVQGEGWTLQDVNGQYLYAAGGTGKNNYLKAQTTLSAPCYWNITIGADGVATVKTADATVARHTMRYNSSSKLFSCYASGQDAIVLYVGIYGYGTTCSHEGTPAQVATCSSKAICAFCGEEFGEYDYNNHVADGKTELRNAVAVGCLTDGYTGDLYCLECGKLISSGETVTKLGHAFGEYTYNNDASCTKAGTKTAHCTHDGCEVTDTVADETHGILPHEYSGGSCIHCGASDPSACEHGQDKLTEVTTPATCEQQGNQTYYQCACGKFFADSLAQTEITDLQSWLATNTTEQLGHLYDSEHVDFVWNGTTAVARLACQRQGCNHVNEVTATVSAGTTEGTPSTCTTAGNGYFVASVTVGEVTVTSEEHCASLPLALHSFDESNKCTVCQLVLATQTVTLESTFDTQNPLKIDKISAISEKGNGAELGFDNGLTVSAGNVFTFTAQENAYIVSVSFDDQVIYNGNTTTLCWTADKNYTVSKVSVTYCAKKERETKTATITADSLGVTTSYQNIDNSKLPGGITASGQFYKSNGMQIKKDTFVTFTGNFKSVEIVFYSVGGAGCDIVYGVDSNTTTKSLSSGKQTVTLGECSSFTFGNKGNATQITSITVTYYVD